jgi:CheY-like chemotaxis protein/two-component sensor histidine kinase
VASHEIRTPVNAVVGALDRLQRIDAGGLSSAQRELMGLARTAARNLAALVNNLLDLSKVDAGQLALSPQLADLRSDLEAQAVSAKAEATARNLSFNLLLDSQLAPALVYDALRLQQIVSNLVTNALKFTREGGITLEVRVLRDSASAQTLGIAVHDTGIGIAPDKAARLFRPYVQADAQVARDFGGTGLGLALCRRLVVAMGGTIGMTSEPGKGTRVELEVTLDKPGAPAFVDSLPEQAGLGAFAGAPAAAPGAAAGDSVGDGAAMNAAPGAAATPGLALQLPQGLRALLVDDDRVQQILLGAALDELGIAHDTANHGTEALALWQQHEHALIITDIHMPELDGPALARALRATPRGAQLTILGTSADLDIRDAAMAAGMDDAILKPASAQSIGAWLAAHPLRGDKERA